MGFLRTKRRIKWASMLGVEREKMASWRRSGLSSLAILGLCLTLGAGQSQYNYILGGFNQLSRQSYDSGSRAASRHLLSANKSDIHGPVWEQCTYESENYPGAWVFNHTLWILVIFIALAVVCDDFFVPSLEAISEKLSLSEDVAGATFMAAGSSAPELFTSVAGVAVETDVGVGTIVGSAVFNILIIIALTAALAGKALLLDWRPLIRDSFFYAMSIACFVGFAWDGYFMHYEAAILLVLYIVYIVLMAFNPKLMDWMGTWRCWPCGKQNEEIPLEMLLDYRCQTTTVLPVDEETCQTSPESPDMPTGETNVNVSHLKLKDIPSTNGTRTYPAPLNHARRVSLISQKSLDPEKHIFHHHHRGSIVGTLTHHMNGPKKSLTPEDPISEEPQPKPEETPQISGEEDEADDTIQLCPCLPCCPAVRTYPPSPREAKQEGGCWNWFKLILRWIIFIPAFPFFVLFSWTIPDCSKEHNRKMFLFSFLMSVLWIATLSFGMVTLVSRTGCILGFDSYTMGLVVIAMGTSIPDAMSSVLVARDGYGDMAVSNAIGSNVFDINLGLGLPFIIRIAIDAGKPITLLSPSEWGDYYTGKMVIVPHAKFGFILLFILILGLSAFGAVRFRLTKSIGISFVFLYVLFLTYAFIQELYCVRTLNTYC